MKDAELFAEVVVRLEEAVLRHKDVPCECNEVHLDFCRQLVEAAFAYAQTSPLIRPMTPKVK